MKTLNANIRLAAFYQVSANIALRFGNDEVGCAYLTLVAKIMAEEIAVNPNASELLEVAVAALE